MNFYKPLFWDLKKPNIYSYLLLPFTLILMINNFIVKKTKKKSTKKFLAFVLEIFTLEELARHQQPLNYMTKLKRSTSMLLWGKKIT